MDKPYQNYLSVSDDQDFHQQISSVAGEPLHRSHSFTDDILRTIQQDSPYLLILDGSSPKDTISLIKRLRNRHPLANIPVIVVTSPQYSFGTTLSLFKNISALAIEDVPFELKMYIEIAVDEQFIDRSLDQTHSYSMEFFADLWREGGSVTVLLENERSFTLHRGGVLSLADLPTIEKSLFSPPPRYQRIESKKNGDWISVGTILWRETQRYCRSGFLKHRKWLIFIPTQYSFRALELPISLPTRKLLFSTETDKPLIHRIRELQLNIPQIEQDIEALYLLGLYSFQKTETQQYLGAQNQTEETESTLVPKENWNDWLEESLQEQWRKRHLPNPWTALDFSPEKDLASQLEKRTENIKIFTTISSPYSQKKLQQIIDHIEFSKPLLAFSKHLYEIYGYPAHPDQEESFFQALALLRERNIAQASTLIQNLPNENLIYRAFKGWILFLSADDEHKKAFELISSSLHQTKTSVVFELLACIVLLHLQQWNIAERRLLFLVNIYNTEQLRSLLWYCQSQQIPAKDWFKLY